jgi:hypothetical protein
MNATHAEHETSSTTAASHDELVTTPAPETALAVVPVWARDAATPCSGCTSDDPCSDCSGGAQRKAEPGAQQPTRSGGTALARPSGPGSALSAPDVTRFSTVFGHDLSRVRLHTGGEATALARSHGALAYTEGSDVLLGGSFAPGSRDGDTLLAHELAHVVQQHPGHVGAAPAGGDQARLEEEADRAAELAVAGRRVGQLSAATRESVQLKASRDPPDSAMTAGLSWFEFSPVKGATYSEDGDEHIQLSGLVLKNLLGGRYSAELRDRILSDLHPPLRWKYATTVKRGDPHPAALVRPSRLKELLAACAKEQAPVTLSPEKQRYLELGVTSSAAYWKLAGVQFPAWFSRELFNEVVAHHIYLLQRVAQGSADEFDIVQAIGIPVDVLNAIRKDTALIGHAGYAYLWPRTKGAPPAVAAEDQEPQLDPAAWLLAYLEARPKTASAALPPATGGAARKNLLDGFVATYDIKQVQPTHKGDQPLSEVPSTYTAPPYPSTLSVYPQLDGGLYGSTRGEYGFQMALQFPNIISQFQFHRYEFTVFRVPDDKLVNAAAAMKGSGRSPSRWGLLKGRLARDKQYQEADVHAYAGSLWNTLGPPGVSLNVTQINAGLRYLGTVVGTLIEAIFDPSYIARFRFDEAGLYIVRCVATWDAGREVALKRPPSVAYVFLFARAAELLAEEHLQAFVSEQDEARKRIAEINRDLPSIKDSKRKEERTKERDRLAAATGGVEGLLTYQRDILKESKEPDVGDRIRQLNRILGTRAARGFGKDTERLPATYVNDAGQVIDLLIEVQVTNQRGPDDADYEVNDATTPSSLSASASGARRTAIRAALEDLLRKSDYGRGRATVLLDGTYEAIDVPTVSAGKMFMEALSNTAMILSIVAIALAPVTAGASMVLMMPAMIVGAVPSVYNIVKRGLVDKTLHADLALAMDIVNVVGAAIGAGAETRAGLQAIRLGTAGGKVMVVMGLGAMGSGVLVMGASIVEQLDAVRAMPEGLQQAEVMKILSQAMLHAGIMMGAMLAAQLKVRGAREGATFEDWLSSLDERSRSMIEESRSEREPARNLWRVWAEMDPVVRDLLTQCGSECASSTPPSKGDQARLKTVAMGLSERGYRTLQGLLHDNREPAAFQKLLTELESARSAAPKSKGGVKKIAAVEAEILDRGTLANDLLAKLSAEKVNTRAGPPDPRRWARTVKLADEVATAGKIPMEILRRVLDNVRAIPGANPEEVLQFLKRVGDLYGKVPGTEKLLGSRGLAGGYRDFEGARWTFQFLEDNRLWNDVKAFEDPVPGTIDRVVDIRLSDGTRIELKSWERWHHWANVSFAQQIMGDYFGTGGFTGDPVKWVFEPGGKGGVQSEAALIKRMNAALDQALAEKWDHYNDAGARARVDAIKAKLRDIVRVGKLK